MRLNNDDDIDEKPDFFDGEDIQENEKEKKPKYSPEDPRYWEEEESEWEHLKIANKKTVYLWIAASVITIFVICALWVRFFRPYSEGGIQYGYVDKIERCGAVFKTYEGTLLPYKNLMDTTRVYERDFIFTAKNEAIAIQLKKYMEANQPVKIEYKEYQTSVPWRGDSKIIVIGVDSINKDLILPPDKNIEE
jgi:hypothetical protein